MNEQFVSSAIENAISFCLLIEYMIEEVPLWVALLPDKGQFFFNTPTVTTTAIESFDNYDYRRQYKYVICIPTCK